VHVFLPEGVGIWALSVVLKLWDMIKILKDGTYRHARNEMQIKSVMLM
jgi:hypothetical protein